MPLPAVPIIVPIVTMAGAAALSALALRRRLQPGRTDQRAEDALDATDEGVALHRPRDGATQTNATARLRRTIRIGRHSWDIDAAALARLRIRRL